MCLSVLLLFLILLLSHVVCFVTTLIACLCFPSLTAVLCETVTMVTASKTKCTPRRRRRERQRSLIDEQETLSRVVKRDESVDKITSGVVSPRRRPCIVAESCDTKKEPMRTEFHQRHNGAMDAWSEGPVRIKSMCMLNSEPAEITTSTTATTGAPFVRNDGFRMEGDDISLASNASSLSTSSTVTTDSGTATTDSGANMCIVDGTSDAFKRQSASSLSDLDHMGKLVSGVGWGGSNSWKSGAVRWDGGVH